MEFIVKMEKLLAIIGAIPADKQGHALIGAILFALSNLIFSFAVPSPWCGIYSLLGVCLVGSLKELYDAFNPDKHTCDFWDFFATATGGVIGFIATIPYQTTLL
ncbi:hypothetical protein [Undibacterium crateris]|uniref:hypothetical protein n=1 Tax=Undibacterium crateris TaxID=2528175 RepID=UPI00138A1D5A|nr:hypothetical protein [Undibacterium crateris]NDI85079.1 hypothetical protein [Undibacterium crateris]